jgi:hypothetical protein
MPDNTHDMLCLGSTDYAKASSLCSQILSGIIPVVWSEAGRKWVCNDSQNTTIFAKILENNYMFRPLIEWAIIRLKQENNMSPLHSRTPPKVL